MNTVQDKLEQIKADIASEKLTYPQIRERLETLIEHEYSKEGGPDVDLVIACEDLLWRLGTDNAPFVTHEDQYKEAIRSRIEASQRTRQIKKPVLRFVAALAVVVLLLGGAEVFLHREWFEQSDTADQQQHIVQGFEIDTELIEKAIAGGNEVKRFSSASYQEIKAFLGFDLPASVFLSDWEATSFSAYIQPAYIRVVIRYNQPNNEENNLILSIKMFTDPENAYATFEQAREGIKKEYQNDVMYIAQNETNTTILFVKKNCIYNLYGSLPSKTIISLAEKIIGGIKDE